MSSSYSGITFLTNKGDGNYIVGEQIEIYDMEFVFKCGNLDDNPLPEIVFKTSSSSSLLGILYNYNKDDIFYINMESMDPPWITIGDVDGNGLKDIIITPISGPDFGIYYNYGYKNFSEMKTVPVTGWDPVAIRCADLNNDGVDDVVVGGESIEVYLSRGNHTFSHIKIDSLHLKDKLDLYDFNNDGLIDIVTDYFCYHNGDSLSFFKNNGDETFTKITKKIETPVSSFYVINDYNQDGLYDIAYIYAGIGFKILYNLGDFNFSMPHFVPAKDMNDLDPFLYNNTCQSKDFDNNVLPDFVYANSLSSVKFLFNDGNGNFVDNPVSNATHTKQQNSYLQCSPNPFMQNINIDIQLKKPSDVNLTIYDINGRPVACLINKTLPSGKHNINTGKLESMCTGTYCAVLKVNGKTIEVKKIVKTK